MHSLLSNANIVKFDLLYKKCIIIIIISFYLYKNKSRLNLFD